MSRTKPNHKSDANNWTNEILGRVIRRAICDFQGKPSSRDRIDVQVEAKRWLFDSEGNNTLECFVKHYSLDLNIGWLRDRIERVRISEEDGLVEQDGGEDEFEEDSGETQQTTRK